MSYRRSYEDDPMLCDQVFGLLERVWPTLGIGRARRGAERFGAPWESASTPFVVPGPHGLLSHVGLLPLPLTASGRPVLAGGVHGVATDPGARRRGHFRALMEELIPFAEARYETLILTTAHPEYFEPFGFRVIPEHVFTTPVEMSAGPSDVRSLDLENPADRELVRRLLDTRTPVSHRLGVRGEKVVWAFYEVGNELRYSAALDLLIVAERSGDVLRLLDLVGPRIPALDELIAMVGGHRGDVVTFFAPDRLHAPFQSRASEMAGGPYALDPGGDNTWLMERGLLLPDDSELMLPRGARC